MYSHLHFKISLSNLTSNRPAKNMKEFQTPHRDVSRSSDLTYRKSQKKSQKIPKKNLSGLFTSVSSDSSPISEITEISASSSETNPPAEITPISKVASVTHADVAVGRCEFNNVEADVAGNLLKELRTEVINCSGLKSKKVLDALIELVINEYNSCSGESDRCREHVSMKICAVVLCLALWCVAVLGFLFFGERVNESYAGVPT